ncbi:MAG: NF038129 family PEP-CTERM protein [Bryobacterales bacterium]|nr:NF038129 family PEP-CTERM protein [Bryobacterales bacterium]
MPSHLLFFRNALLLSLVSQCALAGVVNYTVALDTTGLVAHPAGPFYFQMALTDGNGFGDGNNTVTLTNFAFGGGSDLGSPVSFGSVSGSLATGVTMTDTSFLTLFVQQFNPGLSLRFTLGLTSEDDIGGIPDGITWAILDNSGLPLPSQTSGDYILAAGLDSQPPVFSLYGGDTARSPSTGDPISFNAPTVSSVPEPSSVVLVLSGAILAGAVRRGSRLAVSWRQAIEQTAQRSTLGRLFGGTRLREFGRGALKTIR